MAKANKSEKPRYYATDFPELTQYIPEGDRMLYLRFQQQLNGIRTTDDDNAPAADGMGPDAPPTGAPVTLRQLKPITLAAIACIPKGGKDVRVTCPNPSCGKQHCYVKRDDGQWHCWSCGWSGCLEELKSLLGKGSGCINSAYYANAQKTQNAQNANNQKDHVPMIADDFQEVSFETRSWLYPIYPFDSEEQRQRFYDYCHSNRQLATHPKARLMLNSQSVKSLQEMVRAYVEAMGIDKDIVKREGVLCAWMMQNVDDSKSEDKRGVEQVPAIAYCNYLYGKIINVKFRAVNRNPLTGEWNKRFLQVSPTKPCAPYGIESISPLRPEAQTINRLIFTEGEKDRLTLLSCGFPYVLSIANGADTNIELSHEAFEEWILQADEIVVCGDSDLPGRKLVKQLIEHYQARCKVAVLPRGKKDISEVYAAFGAAEVRHIIEEAKAVGEEDIYDLGEHSDDVLDILMGHYDHGYDVGMGKLTDSIFHPTDEGGLIILTGIPNSGKTDFLNCLTTHLMYQCQKRVAFCSFEKPIKGKHVREIARIALGVENTADMDGQESQEEARLVNRKALGYLKEHMVEFDTKSRLPDSDYLIAMAESEMHKKRQKIDYLVIDPYVFINMTEGGARATETEKVRLMLTKLQAWSRTRHIWTLVVAHPRIQNKEGSQDFPDLNIYSIAGSAQWANLADFMLTVRRIHKPEEGKEFSIVEALKVRDQEFCHPGKVFYVRQPCGRYDERESEADCIAEAMQGKVLPKDESPWGMLPPITPSSSIVCAV